MEEEYPEYKTQDSPSQRLGGGVLEGFEQVTHAVQMQSLTDVFDKEELFDPNYLELIVNNLLSNAFKYTESGQSITVTLKEENNWLVLQVSDTGIGIPINKQGKIFERFYQIESEHVGSGIGLSLVQRLVELHHGRIELDSEEGKGSTFSVYLPQDINTYKSSELASNDTLNEEGQVYSTNSKEMYFIDTEKVENETIEGGDKKRGTILIVEDNNEIRHYLSSGLAELFNTLEAGNGEEALEKLKDNEVDIIVTDVMMPVMDGMELSRRIKENLATSHIPFLMLTALRSDVQEKRSFEIGVDEYLCKPFDEEVLRLRIRNILSLRRKYKKMFSSSSNVEELHVKEESRDKTFITNAVNLMKEHYADAEYNLERFVRDMGYSKTLVNKKMQDLTGQPIGQFMKNYRLNVAQRMIQEGSGDVNVSEIAYAVGFNDPKYFTKCFKEFFGYLPSSKLGKKG